MAIADEIELRSYAAHARGIGLLKRSAKLAQLASIMTSEQADRCLASLIAEGFVKLVGGVAQMVDIEGTDEKLEDHLNASGGDA